METVPLCPTPGAGAGTLTPKQANKLFEFFKPGTRREVILLGDLVEQRVHYVRSKNHKVLCTCTLGACSLCLEAATSDDVSTSHSEFYGPAVVRQKDREFHQRVGVFTASMGEHLIDLFAGQPMRGQRFEVVRESTQKFRVIPSKQQPHALAHALPEWFDLLPWIRARYGLPQEASRPLVRVGPFSCRELVGGPGARPRQLELTAGDRQAAEEWAKTQAALELMRQKVKAENATAATAPAEAPAPEPAPAVVEEKKSSDLKVVEIASDPKNYGPKVRLAGGVTNGEDGKSPGAELVGSLVDSIPAMRNGKKGGGK